MKASIAYQERILGDVSRTFALTIPELPDRLCLAVGNAYLLCRIADTIEDDPDMSPDLKEKFADGLIESIDASSIPDDFIRRLCRHLSPSASAGERDLILNIARVLQVTQNLNPRQRRAIRRCVDVMSKGMMKFQRNAGISGLKTLTVMNEYCYYVAGVVGEMLTELFCDHSRDIEARRAQLLPLARSFGQGLQMTNILKDMWEDRARGACWLPQDVFSRTGFELHDAAVGQDNSAMATGLRELIAISRGHLEYALKYVLLIPASEKGIRRHCLLALGMAVMTLRSIHSRPDFSQGNDVKISRRSVKGVIIATVLSARSDSALKLLFSAFTRTLPRTEPSALPPAAAYG